MEHPCEIIPELIDERAPTLKGDLDSKVHHSRNWSTLDTWKLHLNREQAPRFISSNINFTVDDFGRGRGGTGSSSYPWRE